MLTLAASCHKDAVKPAGSPGGDSVVVQPPPADTAFDINAITDTYADIAPFQYHAQWSVYNVHDPSIRKFGDYYYCYSTDVAYGMTVRPGIQVRKSKDLVEWRFDGWAFSGIPDEAAAFIRDHGGTPNDGLWAPYVLKAGGEYRLYYALSSTSATPRLSVIGLATASSPEGPWKERGLVVSSLNDNSVQTNAIDPSVVVCPDGDQWMYYGSAFDGIYVLKLDPATGLAASSGDKGKRIVQRGSTAGKINGNLEAPEIIYNDSLRKYFLFMSYDWLETKYNVRVGRADAPEGPFYDFEGHDLNEAEDHLPMILAPYRFSGQSGWQGTGGCSVFTDAEGSYFMGHNARPSENKYFMDLHVRRIYWTKSGWPVVSPERYAWDKDSLVPEKDLPGDWERIVLNYQVTPGYQAEQVSPDLQVSVPIHIAAAGALTGNGSGSWTYDAPWLTLKWSGGETDEVMVRGGRDWEHKRRTVIFTGLNNNGRAVWGKRDGD